MVPCLRMPSKTVLATFAATSATHLPLKARGPTRGPVQAPLDGAPCDLYEPVCGTPLCRNLLRTPTGPDALLDAVALIGAGGFGSGDPQAVPLGRCARLVPWQLSSSIGCAPSRSGCRR
jgi:hypothetical protein